VDSRTRIVSLFVAIVVISLAGSFTFADAGFRTDLTTLLQVMTEMRSNMVNQNSIIIEQNNIAIDQRDEIIQLLHGNKNIFVAGLTERYDILEWGEARECRFYDKLERETLYETCPIRDLTRDEFRAMITGNPEH